jgi:hypothetical protein
MPIGFFYRRITFAAPYATAGAGTVVVRQTNRLADENPPFIM